MTTPAGPSARPKPHESLPGFRRGMETLQTLKAEAQRQTKAPDRVADFFTRFSGSATFVWFHALWFAVWMAWNSRVIPGVKPFDPFPFGLLTMIVSLEAIFLSTFVLISQNRDQRISAIRDEFETRIALYQEQELTQVLRIVHRIEKHLGLKDQDEKTVRAMEHFIDSDDLFREIESSLPEG